jgi:hypothetical protein
MRRRAQSDEEDSGGSEDFLHTGSQALLHGEDDGGRGAGRSAGSRLVAFMVVVAGLVCVGTLAVSQGVVDISGHGMGPMSAPGGVPMVGSGPAGEVQPLRRKKKKKSVFNSVDKVDKVSPSE